MEPFRIVCPSCSSKIVVRHAQLVGQTLPCPKCQASVLVVAPVKESATAPPVESTRPQVVNSDAITQVDPADWNMDALDTNRLPDFVPWSANPSPNEAAPAFVPPSNSDGNTASAALRSPVSGKWESQKSVARRNVLLLISIVAGGLLIAVLAFVAFIRVYGRTADRRTAEANSPPIASPQDPPQKELGAQPTPNPIGIPSTDAENPASEPEPEASSNVEVPTDSDPQSSESTSNETMTKDSDTGDSDNSSSSSSSPLFPNFEPAASDDPAKLGNPLPPEETAALENADDNLPSIFQDFQRMFDPPSRSNWDDIGKADRIIENEVSIENAEVLLRDEFYPPAIAIPIWSEQAERVLTSIQTKPMPLLRCIDWFSKVSNTGITVDWFDMNLAAVDWNDTIAIEAQNESLGSILGRILQERGLELVVDEEGFPHVRPTLDTILAKLGQGTLLDSENGLTAFPPELRDAVVPLLIRLLDLSSCTYSQGQLVWSTDASHYDKARFMASMRNLQEAIATAPEKKEFPADALDFGRPGAWWSLRQRIQVPLAMENIVFEERPVIDLLATAAAASRTRLVIDWPAVWSHGFHPSRMSVSVLRGRSLEEISNRYLEDYALELVPLDSETVLLTTDVVRRSIERVIAIRLDQGLNMDDLKTAIRTLIPRGLDQRSRFKLETVPGGDQVALLRICLPTVAQFRDRELQKALGVASPPP